MEIKELMEKFDRNINVEKNSIDKMYHSLRPHISKKQITKTLEDNGFNGFYVVPDSTYKSVTDNLMSAGYYNIPNKVVIINEDDYIKLPAIGIHELCHAYLDDKNVKHMEIDGQDLSLGKGLEEGAASILQTINSVSDINKVNPISYQLQSNLFQQLNVLYKYSKIKDTPNLLIFLLKHPEQFLSLIKDIYCDILGSQCCDFDKFIPCRCAHRLITLTDILTEQKSVDKNIYYLANCINSLYLTIADSNIRDGKNVNPLFCVPNEFLINSETRLLLCLFGMSVGEKVLSNVDLLLAKIDRTIENIEETKSQNSKTLILKR